MKSSSRPAWPSSRRFCGWWTGTVTCAVWRTTPGLPEGWREVFVRLDGVNVPDGVAAEFCDGIRAGGAQGLRRTSRPGGWAGDVARVPPGRGGADVGGRPRGSLRPLRHVGADRPVGGVGAGAVRRVLSLRRPRWLRHFYWGATPLSPWRRPLDHGYWWWRHHQWPSIARRSRRGCAASAVSSRRLVAPAGDRGGRRRGSSTHLLGWLRHLASGGPGLARGGDRLTMVCLRRSRPFDGRRVRC